MTLDTNEFWYKDAVFYELHVRVFADGNADGKGDFAGLTSRLDHLQELGIDCVWLLPIYPSPLNDDGYDIADFYGVHPDYGNLDEFRTMVEAAHRRGIRVIADLVLNHTSDQHPWFTQSRASRQSPKRDWYVWSDSGQEYSDARIIFLDIEESNWSYDEQAGQYFWHRFFSSQPDLNYDNPAVRAEMLNVLRFWMDTGIDGFRADAIPYLIEREGTNCENLPETHDYLKQLRAEMDAHYPGRILLCEANQWPEDVRPYFGDPEAGRPEFHMGFHFPLMPRLYMALRRADRSSVIEIMRRTPDIPTECQWCIFLRNHDELTLEMVTEEERQYMWAGYAPEPRMRLNLGIRRRLAPLLDNDRRRIELMNSLLFTLPGSPIIYYGDEIGMGDNIWLPDRNGVRTPMQWDAGPNAGFSEADPDQLYAPLIDDPVFGYRQVNVAAQRVDPGSLFNLLRRFISVRKAHLAFGRGDLAFLEPPNQAVLAYLRSFQGETILAVHNLAAEPQEAALDLAAFAGARPLDLLSGETLDAVETGPFRLLLPAYGYRWLKLA